MRVYNTKDFIEKLCDTNDSFLNGEFSIMSSYISSHSPITVRDKYGLGTMQPNNLLSNKSPSIKSAYYRTSYFINQAKEIHGDKYDYSKVEFISNKTKIRIICKEHGEFQVTPNKHLSLKQGCVICSNKKLSSLKQENPTGYNLSNWIKAAKASKKFDSFKVYVIKCWDEEETFFKIGRTYRTVKNRFKITLDLPYNFEVLKTIENTEPEFIWKLEVRLKRLNKKNKYIPKKKFNGMYECYNKLF